MNILKRLINRIRFKKIIKTDESINVVDSMVKARLLYRELSKVAHPDRNPGKEKVAEQIMKRVVANKHNYACLLELREEVKNSL